MTRSVVCHRILSVNGVLLGILNIQIYWKLILFIRVVMGLEREFNNNIIKITMEIKMTEKECGIKERK